MNRAKHDLRKLAEGKPCQVRLPGCDGGGETTILAHYRRAGECGMGMKPPDLLGAWSCFNCHQISDGRAPSDLPREHVRLMHSEGCLRTLAKLIEMGILKW